MANFGDMKARIRSDLSVSTTTLDPTDAIHDAVDYWQDRPLYFNQLRDVSSTTLVAGQPNYAIPANVQRISHMRLNWGGENTQPLIRRDWDWYIEVSRDGVLQAVPSGFFAIFDEQVWLWPTPSQGGLPLEFYGVERLTPYPLTNDSDENAWTNEGRLLIAHWAKGYIYEHELGNPGLASRMYASAEQHYVRLAGRSGAYVGRGETTPTMF